MRKLTAIGAVAAPLAILAAGGVAWAAWNVQGTGSGRAAAGQSVPLVVLSATPSTQLHPGGTADLAIQVRNDNPFPVTITAVTRRPKPVTVDAGHAACPVSVVETTGQQDLFTVDWHLTAGQVSTFSLPGAVQMDISAPDACQGAAFGLPMNLAATSS